MMLFFNNFSRLFLWTFYIAIYKICPNKAICKKTLISKAEKQFLKDTKFQLWNIENFEIIL